MRKFGLTFAVVAALGVGALSAGTTAAPVLAASNTVSSSAGTAGASTSALSGKKKAAKRKALRKCNRKHLRAKRKACRRSVNKRFAIEPVPVEPVEPSVFIDVRDDYFSPAVVNIKSGEAVGWVWYEINHDPHNVTLIDGPAGVDLMDFQTSSSPAEGYRWSRTFVKKGTYSFSCSLHKNMDMTVSVS